MGGEATNRVVPQVGGEVLLSRVHAPGAAGGRRGVARGVTRGTKWCGDPPALPPLPPLPTRPSATTQVYPPASPTHTNCAEPPLPFLPLPALPRRAVGTRHLQWLQLFLAGDEAELVDKVHVVLEAGVEVRLRPESLVS